MANSAGFWRQFRALRGRVHGGVAVGLVVIVVVAGASACSSETPASTTNDSLATTTTAGSDSTPATASTDTAVPTNGVANSTPGTCHATGSGLYVLPDPACTPGVTNPNVSQANIGSTICTSGWTATIRPPESYTETLKQQQMAAYGDAQPISYYEEDHLISLELGGNPTSPQNLWPEPGASPNPKDSVENAAKRAVCDGTITLAAAQHAIASNWIAFGQQLGVTSPPSGSSPAPAPATAAPSTAPSTAASGGCSPTTSTGNCYKPGEYCPTADHGMTGTGAGGQPIKCEDVNGTWRWEAA